ncbi:MAG: diguanylate cyclase [Nitrospirae bacterium]|nr:diguanylate cyclase [Nitrospirota bacterium]
MINKDLLFTINKMENNADNERPGHPLADSANKTGHEESISLDLIPDPFVILSEEGIISDLNASCARLLGIRKDNLIGRYYKDFGPMKILSEKVTESIKNATEDFDLSVYDNKHYEIFILPFKTRTGLSRLRIILKDITNFVSLERELLKRNKELMVINTLSSAFISSDNMDSVVENLLKKVLLITDYKIGWILLKEEHAFRLKSSLGISAELRGDIEGGAFEAFSNDLIKAHEPIHLIESPALDRINALPREGITTLTVVPLIYSQDTIGLLFLGSKAGKGNSLDFDSAALLSLVGNHVSLIVDKIKLFLETKRLSITDGLTGLYNSRYFYKQLDLEILRSNRYGHSFSLILFDIDNFKQLNDTHGHQAGDDVLNELARILKNVSRETDIVVRYGGEEFIIILPNTSEEDTINLANRIRMAVEQNLFIANHGGGVNITLSGGIASYPQNASDAKRLLNAADTSLYAAKASGKNKIVCFAGKSHGNSI